MSILLRLCLSLASLGGIHDHRNGRQDADGSNNPGQNLDDLDLVAFTEPTGQLSHTAALEVSPHCVDQDSGDDPEDGAHDDEYLDDMVDVSVRCPCLKRQGGRCLKNDVDSRCGTSSGSVFGRSGSPHRLLKAQWCERQRKSRSPI